MSNIFKITIDQITMCDVSGVAHRDKPTDIYNPTAIPLSSSGCFSIFSGLQLYSFFFFSLLLCVNIGYAYIRCLETQLQIDANDSRVSWMCK